MNQSLTKQSLIPTNLLEIVEYLETLTPPERVEFFRNPTHLFIFWFYYFPQNFECELATFHDDWLWYLGMTDMSLLFIAFRGSLKTEETKIYVLWLILYAVEEYIVVQSYEQTASNQWVRNLGKMMVSTTIVNDFGNLHPYGQKRQIFEKSGSADFDARNGVKVQAISLGENARGISNYSEEQGTKRPTLLILDDVDNNTSTYTRTVIDKNHLKITGETIGAMSKKRSRIIFLWNVIRTDGVVPRFEKEKAGNTHWKIFRQPLFDERNQIAWKYFTPERVEQIKADEWKVAFGQNYLLIPYTGDSILSRDLIRYGSCPVYDHICIGIDPAISEKSTADKLGICATGFIDGKWRYVIESYGLLGRQKDPSLAINFIFELYTRLKARTRNGVFCLVEVNAFQSIFRKLMQEKNIASRWYTSSKDKVTRFLENEPAFNRGEIFFEDGKNTDLVADVLQFPESEYKDIVDAMVFSFMGHNLSTVHRITSKR